MAADELFPAVYHVLRAMARRQLDGERADHTLQPTALVHEAFLKLNKGSAARFNDRPHFLRVAAEAMRRILIDHAKARGRAKRDGRLKCSLLDAVDVAVRSPPDDLLRIDEAVCRLEQVDARAAAVVRLRFYAGLSLDETAAALDVSVHVVRRDWTYARAHLFHELTGEAN